ncbi:hypothetical protein CC78DRAFT_573209 [Lojkania enalia]|uniref:Uncharacterized protein n=1 Tax=Lojkania enalia TaxID=147567 RepID=A0A9P4TRZ2_9PLEO|nr:hypothetical protein CC78DRAFT_573209 [Didymosphaeria enalia]
MSYPADILPPTFLTSQFRPLISNLHPYFLPAHYHPASLPLSDSNTPIPLSTISSTFLSHFFLPTYPLPPSTSTSAPSSTHEPPKDPGTDPETSNMRYPFPYLPSHLS